MEWGEDPLHVAPLMGNTDTMAYGLQLCWENPLSVGSSNNLFTLLFTTFLKFPFLYVYIYIYIYIANKNIDRQICI